MNAISRRIEKLASKLGNQRYRNSYLSQHLRMFLAAQIRALRGNLSQAAFGRLLGKPQSVVSRLENSDYGKVTLQTLLEIAQKLNVALIVRFVSYPTFLRYTDDMSQSALRPGAFDQNEMNRLVLPAHSADADSLGAAVAAQGRLITLEASTQQTTQPSRKLPIWEIAARASSGDHLRAIQ